MLRRVDSSINFSTNGAGPELIFYLTGSGNPALVLDADANFGALGVGLATSQTAAPFSFNGPFGLSFVQSSGSLENHGTGQVTAAGSAGTLAGAIDTDLSFSSQPNTALTGSFAVIGSNGRATGGLTNTFFPHSRRCTKHARGCLLCGGCKPRVLHRNRLLALRRTILRIFCGAISGLPKLSLVVTEIEPRGFPIGRLRPLPVSVPSVLFR